MNSASTYTTSTNDSEGTRRLAGILAARLKGNETVELIGDLGSGKTTFTQGLIEALGYSQEIVSPTFTISRDYPIRDNHILHHYDLYRLRGHDIATDELREAVNDPQAITVIEWPDHGEAQKVLPSERITITFEYGELETERTIVISATSPGLGYITEGLLS